MPYIDGQYLPSHHMASVSIGTSPTIISSARQGRTLYVQPNGSVDVYIGGPGVTTSAGILLSHSSTPPTLFSDQVTSADWYAVASGSTTVLVDEIY